MKIVMLTCKVGHLETILLMLSSWELKYKGILNRISRKKSLELFWWQAIYDAFTNHWVEISYKHDIQFNVVIDLGCMLISAASCRL